MEYVVAQQLSSAEVVKQSAVFERAGHLSEGVTDTDGGWRYYFSGTFEIKINKMSEPVLRCVGFAAERGNILPTM